MSERKSNRSRKVVDYSKFSRDGDSDDDFADPTPPPSKKQKISKEDKVKDNGKSKVNMASSREKRRLERIPVEEKQFEQELQFALEMSRIDSQSSAPSFTENQEENPPVIDKIDNLSQYVSQEEPLVVNQGKAEPPLLDTQSSEDIGPTKITVTADINPTRDDYKENIPKRNVRVASKITGPVHEKEEIIVLEENISPTKGRGKRKAANKASCQLKVTSDSESDREDTDKDTEFKLSGQGPASDSESDESEFDLDDDGDDSDFGESKSKNKAKSKGKTPKRKSTVKTSTPKPREAVSKTDKKATQVSSARSVSKTPSNVRIPNVGGAAAKSKSPCVSAGLVSKSPSLPGGLTSKSPLVGGMAAKSPLVGTKPMMRSPALSAARKPAWTPPGPAGGKSSLGGTTIKSPGGTVGVLRQGLSRNVRLKPLHASFKVPH